MKGNIKYEDCKSVLELDPQYAFTYFSHIRYMHKVMISNSTDKVNPLRASNKSKGFGKNDHKPILHCNIEKCDRLGDIYKFGYDHYSDRIISAMEVDAEWYSRLKKKLKRMLRRKGVVKVSELITKQIKLKTNHGVLYIVIWSDKFKLPNIDKIKEKINHPLIIIHGDIEKMVVDDVIKYLGIDYARKVPVYSYYAPLDYLCLMSRDHLRNFFKANVLTKLRNMNGRIPLQYIRDRAERIIEVYGFSDRQLSDIDSDTSEDFDILEFSLEGKSVPNVTFQIRDIAGAFNLRLDQACESVGIDIPSKNLISKKFKSIMNVAAIKNPIAFLLYGLGDVMVLENLWSRKVELTNQTVIETLKFDPGFTVDNMPRTTGALVSRVNMLWMEKEYPGVTIAAESLAIPGVEDVEHHNRFLDALETQPENIREGFINLEKSNSRGVIKKVKARASTLFKEWDKRDRSAIAGLARGSIGALGAIPSNRTKYNAIVNGGRCVNENPLEFYIRSVFDIDISGCYGSNLRKANGAVGRPRTIADKLDAKVRYTLGEFIDEYLESSEWGIDDGFWQILVSNKSLNGVVEYLKFRQNVLQSKPDVTCESIDRNLKESIESDDGGAYDQIKKAHVDGTLKLLLKEIKNGVITSSSYEVLKAVASSSEWEAIRGLVLESAAFYSRRDEVTTDEFVEIMCDREKRGGLTQFDNDRSHDLDNRSHAWCRIPYEGFIGKFLDKRKELKKKKDSTSQLLQKQLKLFINTLYGCLAAPYFPFSNAITANNITDKARMGVWKISIVLATIMCITDGGAFSNEHIRYLNTKLKRYRKPTLDSMSDYEGLNKHRGIGIKSLIDDFEGFYLKAKEYLLEDEQAKKDYENGLLDELPESKVKPLQDLIDSEALKHIKEFWAVYGLDFDFDVEFKLENTAREMIYTNSSDYLLIDPVKPSNYLVVENGVVKGIFDKSDFLADDWSDERYEVIPYTIKVRGAKEIDHVKKLYLFYLGGYINKPDPLFEKECLIGVNEAKRWWKSPAMEGWMNDVLPGEVYTRIEELKPTSNFLPSDTYKEYKNKERQIARRKRSYMNQEEENERLFGIYDSLPKRLPHPSKFKTKKTKLKHPYYKYLFDGGDSRIFEQLRVEEISKTQKKKRKG